MLIVDCFSGMINTATPDTTHLLLHGNTLVLSSSIHSLFNQQQFVKECLAFVVSNTLKFVVVSSAHLVPFIVAAACKGRGWHNFNVQIVCKLVAELAE